MATNREATTASGTSERLYVTTTEGGSFTWHALEDALWHVEMMRKWAERSRKPQERMTLRSFTVPVNDDPFTG